MSTYRSAAVTLTAAALLAGTALTAAAPAQAAAPLAREQYSGTFEDTFTECGYDFAVSATWSGTFVLRAGRDGGPAVGLDQYRFVDTYTNLDTGRSFTTKGTGVYRDGAVEALDGSLYAVTFTDTGATFAVYGEDGRRLYQVRGRTEFRVVVDTSGDADHTNDEVVEFEYVGSRGPTVDSNDFCADALALTT